MMRSTVLILFALFLNTSNAAHPEQGENTQPGPWSTDVIGIKEMHLSANYWVEQTENATQVFMDQVGIEDFNKHIFSTNEHMVDLTLFPDQFEGHEVKDRILAMSKPNKAVLYDPDGMELSAEGYTKYTADLGLENIPANVQVQFALVVNRSDMRAYPTDDRYYKTRDKQNLDRFQENGLFPGDALAVLHFSEDKKWAFVQSYNYASWVKKEDIAIGDRDIIEQYKSDDRFLVITGDKVWTSFNPEVPALSELQLDMGIRIPLAEQHEDNHDLYGQNPYTSYTVLLPVRNPQGRLEIRPALIARNKDVSLGYIPFSRENIIRQAFKFLGERYGWGHSYNARDCTGFVMEVYKTFGIHMPRNTGQQGSGGFGENTRFTSDSTVEERLLAFKNMDVGDLIYVPGHVLMSIGKVDGEPYVIHDVSVFRYTDENGEYYEGTLNGVSVTPIIPLHGTKDSTYLELLYNIKSVR